MIPRPSALDVRTVDAIGRFRLAHARALALADERLDAADHGREPRPGLWSELADADRNLIAAERELIALLAGGPAPVYGGVAYLIGPAGQVVTMPVRCLDGRVAARLPGLGVGVA